MRGSPLRAGIALLAASFVVASLVAPARAASTVELSAILPLTGTFALTGQTQERGLHVLEQHVNATGGIQGRPLHFTFLDDQSNPQISVQLVNSVIASGAQVVLGGAGAAMCRATAPLVAKAGPVLYCISPAVKGDPGGFVFSSSVQPYDEITAAMRFFRDKGWTKIAFIGTNDASGQEADQNFTAILKLPENASLQMVAYEHYGPTDISTSAQMARIKAAAPQALVVWAAGNAIATAFHGMHDAGVDLPVATSFSIQTFAAMDQYASILPSQLFFASSKWPAAEIMSPGPVKDQLAAFYGAFKAQNLIPDSGDQIAWDPGLIVVSALRKLGPDAKAAEIHAYLESLRNFAGTSGMYDFTTGDQRGLGLRDVIISEWIPAQRQWIAVSDAGGAALKPHQRPSGN